MIDDRKRDCVVNARFTDREMLDLSRIAALEDRKLADLVHFVIRSYLYGKVRTAADETEGANSASTGN